jgi:molecular chaperone GrpE
MESTIGKDFDVEEMEAITQIPAPTPELAGKVIDEVEKGYKIGEQVLRYAKVVVGKEA